MKFAIACFLTIIVGCQYQSTHNIQKEDSLLIILQAQIQELKTISRPEKISISIQDTLSAKDSLLYSIIHHNYTKAHAVIDSIYQWIPKIVDESQNIIYQQATAEIQLHTDTALIHRLQYLVQTNKQYLQEYHKAKAIIEQNKKILPVFSHSFHSSGYEQN